MPRQCEIRKTLIKVSMVIPNLEAERACMMWSSQGLQRRGIVLADFFLRLGAS